MYDTNTKVVSQLIKCDKIQKIVTIIFILRESYLAICHYVYTVEIPTENREHTTLMRYYKSFTLNLIFFSLH